MPTIRASVGRRDALHLVDLLSGGDAELQMAARERLEVEGVDGLLDDPRVLNALLTDPAVKAPPALVFYVLIRQALLESGIDSIPIADYVASMVRAFGEGARAYRVSGDAEEEYRYLTDMVIRIDRSDPGEAFLLRVHLGNYSLWISGLFPDFVEARCRRKGAPPISYFEEMGSSGYRQAAASPRAEALGMREVFREVSRNFTEVRHALNRVSDRHLWPRAGDPVGKLLREMIDRGP